MNELTPEQKKQIDSWTDQRDRILKDISDKKDGSERLTKTNNYLSESNTEIANKIQQSIGRLNELDRQEVNRATFVLKDVVVLDEKKSILQTEVCSLESDIIELTEKKDNLIKDISSITKTYETVFSRSGEIERIVSETAKINSSNARDIINMFNEASIEFKNIIDIGRENVAVTNRVIAEVPKMIVDIHRDIIERKKINRHKV